MKSAPEASSMPRKYTVVGQMSGTSLDGMDLGIFHFWEEETEWKYEIAAVETISYSDKWRKELENAFHRNAEEIISLDRNYGTFIGQEIAKFCSKHAVHPILAACHGHTVWHQPENGFTLQIGHGGNISAASGLMVVNDFRSQDVALGGQGAPLVPIGDELLFPETKWCLNIGGIANLTDKVNKRAFDICPANMLFNQLAQEMGMEYDRDGNIGRQGTLLPNLLHHWLELSYFSASPPKSLGKEWVDANFPAFYYSSSSIPDRMATAVEMSAILIGRELKTLGKAGIVTGGGAYNSFLMERIETHSQFKIEPANAKIIEFKEALIFGFMGLLRHLNRTNVLSIYTGSEHDHSAGSIWIP